jgi:hypothetical protein
LAIVLGGGHPKDPKGKELELKKRYFPMLYITGAPLNTVWERGALFKRVFLFFGIFIILNSGLNL